MSALTKSRVTSFSAPPARLARARCPAAPRPGEQRRPAPAPPSPGGLGGEPRLPSGRAAACRFGCLPPAARCFRHRRPHPPSARQHPAAGEGGSGTRGPPRPLAPPAFATGGGHHVHFQYQLASVRRVGRAEPSHRVTLHPHGQLATLRAGHHAADAAHPHRHRADAPSPARQRQQQVTAAAGSTQVMTRQRRLPADAHPELIWTPLQRDAEEAGSPARRARRRGGSARHGGKPPSTDGARQGDNPPRATGARRTRVARPPAAPSVPFCR